MAAAAGVAAPGFVLVEARQDRLLETPLLVRLVEQMPAVADQLRRAAIAVERDEAAIEIHVAAVAIQDGDAVERRLDGGEPVLQQLFGRLLVRDVGTDADISALRRAAVADANDAPAGQGQLEGGTGIATLRQPLLDPRFRRHLDLERAASGVGPQDILERGAGAEQVAAAMEFLEARIGQDETLVLIEQGERFRDALDGVHQLALHEIELLRGVTGAKIELPVLPLAVQNQRDEYAADDDDGKKADDQLEFRRAAAPIRWPRSCRRSSWLGRCCSTAGGSARDDRAIGGSRRYRRDEARGLRSRCSGGRRESLSASSWRRGFRAPVGIHRLPARRAGGSRIRRGARASGFSPLPRAPPSSWRRPLEAQILGLHLRHDPAAGLKIAGDERQLLRRVDDAVARGDQESENEDSQPGCPHWRTVDDSGDGHSTSRRRTCQIILAWVPSSFNSG